MSWDREWAPAEEPLPAAAAPPAVSSRPLRLVFGVVLALAVVAALVALGQLPRGHPVVPALAFDLPGLRTHIHLLPSAADYGSVYTLEGTTPHHENGVVVVEGSWNGGAWRRLSEGTTIDGAYSLRFHITHRGSLSLRVTYPGGHADGTVIVP